MAPVELNGNARPLGATPAPSSSSNSNLNAAGYVRTSNILVLGLRRSGKTSILEVVFKNLSPKHTLYIDPSIRIQRLRIDSAIPLEFWDCPSNVALPTLPLQQFSTVLFVIDMQDTFSYSIPKLIDVVTVMYQTNPEINIEIFVHKADALADDYRIETYRHVQQRVFDELTDTNIDVDSLQLQFHLTSIWDHTILESFSQLVQRLIEPLPYLEELLNVFCANSRLLKSFLFDSNSRIYVATDASPVDGNTHTLCCDYVRMLSDFAPLYCKSVEDNPKDASTWSNSSIRLSPDTSLVYWQITRNLCLVVTIPTDVYLNRRGLIEYNLVFFRQGVQEILDLDASERSRKPGDSTSPS
ncbi:hypothetical protein Clacol_002598 [Clathrus columnatus]|uniref:GTP-binding protein n=1 Tax=Clathrus columnatus TaxID=1419009 RepID=A0AAV5A6W3_9AGAM|nr:hypothetical protein Clacol_002598 [Clathrus columnatus]